MADLGINDINNNTIVNATGANKMAVEENGSINVNGTEGQAAANDKYYRVVLELTIAGQAETDLLLIRNAVSSGKRASILGANIGYSDKVSVSGEVRTYENPTITAEGTSLSIFPARIGGSPPASVLTAFHSPTISAKTAQIGVIQISGGTNSAGSKVVPINGSIILDEGGDVLLSIENGQNNQTVILTLSWIEEDI